MDIRPKVETKQIKQMDGNIGYNLCNLSIVKDFLDRNLKKH